MEKRAKKSQLDGEAYRVMFEKATEPAFRNRYYDHHEKGVYCCNNCHIKLFSSKDKFDSGTGWPSFSKAIEKDCLEFNEDYEAGYKRVEVSCKNCNGHLGHVFYEENPNRFCINSLSLDFVVS
jgi:peptide-methionine (R)-S-oxide reductase